MKDLKIYDILGVGAGVFNLSLNALLQKTPLKTHFLESKDFHSWYPNLLFNNAKLQNSYLRDLVSLVDPCNKYSFLSYLNAHKRMYSFLNSDFDYIYRLEFANYLKWAAKNMTNILYKSKVVNVDYIDKAFRVETSDNDIYYARNLSVGIGREPKIPDFIPANNPNIKHAVHVSSNGRLFAGKNILIVGGGQTGAEMFENILSFQHVDCTKITWISSRQNFLPIDDSPFVNEYYTPSYVDSFLQYDKAIKTTLLSDQKLSSDGISLETLKNIYQLLYKNKYLVNKDQQKQLQLLPNHKLTSVEVDPKDRLIVSLTNKTKGISFYDSFDLVILCTGFEFQFPSFLDNLKPFLSEEDECLQINDDYSISSYLNDNKIFILNGAKHTHGVSDPNISTMAWRSARIINSLLHFQFYNTDNSEIFLDI